MTSRRPDERGSATIWVLACGALLMAVAMVGTVRGVAVLARHRAESSADLTALAAAGQIGLSDRACDVAARIAAANGARLSSCRVALDPGGRSGTVAIAVIAIVALPVVGARTVAATARAGREAVPP